MRQLEARTFVHAGKRRGQKQGNTLLTGLVRCGLCDAGMSRAGTSYACGNRRMGRGCEGVTARVESLDRYVTDVFLGRLPALEPGDQTLAAIAERWTKREAPELFAKRDALEAEIRDEEGRLADLEDARYVRGEFDGPDAVARYDRLVDRLNTRMAGLRAALAKLPAPTVDLSPFLDGVLLREAWKGDDTAGRRDRLRLAVDRVVVAKGRRGVRFDGRERVTVVWAGERR